MGELDMVGCADVAWGVASLGYQPSHQWLTLFAERTMELDLDFFPAGGWACQVGGLI